ncbi:topoisomerase 1-associated factor 1 [Coniochaeta sp. 2T2.1]|nr:topoisomerase 1-associated factor 1 [Coniochaeta sp. 2T2.1]
MESEDTNNDVVHPEVRAHINSLVSALGGFSADDDGKYTLGDDALECLRDMRRWIRFYDEKTNRMDVARCIADANLVGGDLLHIIALWTENCSDSKFKARIALACYEVMVPLTWPIERNREHMTINHHRHIPILQLAQLGYKRAIINFDGAPILHTAVRVALPSMAMPIGERTPRDHGIIKLILFFLRNVAVIAPPPGVKYEGDESQLSRSATIDAFSYQDIFLTLLTIASNMGEDFRTEDVTVMEIIFHLVKRVAVKKLFLEEEQLNKAKADELSAVMEKEAAMLRSYKQTAPKRHNRFGTMIWVKREGGKMSSLSGQDALIDSATRELKMDRSKTFRPPTRTRKEEMEPKDLGPPVSLNHRANGQLRGFVEEFLDSGFNPLFQHVRKSIDREAPHVLEYHRSQFFYLVAWFLEAERMRRKVKKGKKPAETSPDEVSGFNLVASVLNQEMFITLNRWLDRAYNDKDWPDLVAVMKAYTQILLTVQEMSDSGNEENEEIADNILNRLFYEEATHDAVANIVRTYKDQGFEYLDACTDLAHTYLRILEAYSKQNVDLTVRSRKRTRRKKKAGKAATTNEDGEEQDNIVEDDDSANDEANAERTTKERKFDFTRFALRFATQGVVDTFVKYTKYYQDLDESQLKRAHRYFYRVCFKHEMSVMLFRVDIIHLLYNMIKGPEPLDRKGPMFKEWEELVKQIIRKCVKKLEERPALITELLFSKIGSTAHYLEYGYEKQTISSNPKPAAELEFKYTVEHDEQIAIAVGALLDKNQADHIGWLKSQLTAAESERRAWEAAEKAMPSVEGLDAEVAGDLAEASTDKEAFPITVRPDTDARRNAMFKNGHLRLLMKLVGMERLAPSLDETPESTWVIPARITSDQLKESDDFINKAEFAPPVFEENVSAEDQLRRMTAPRKKVVYDDDDGLIDDEDGPLFPLGGPTARKVVDADKGPKKIRRRRRKATDELEDVDDEVLNERARKRREKELAKARKIKSELYVHPSDDETDNEWNNEFMAREDAKYQKIHKEMSTHLERLLNDSDDEGEGASQQPKHKKTTAPAKSRKRKSEIITVDSNDSSAEDTDVSSSAKARKRTKKTPAAGVDSSDDDEPLPAPAKRRPRTMGGFLIDSSDEE